MTSNLLCSSSRSQHGVVKVIISNGVAYHLFMATMKHLKRVQAQVVDFYDHHTCHE
jgi:hypothetical protein